jgi:hypothetical protein
MGIISVDLWSLSSVSHLVGALRRKPAADELPQEGLTPALGPAWIRPVTAGTAKKSLSGDNNLMLYIYIVQLFFTKSTICDICHY